MPSRLELNITMPRAELDAFCRRAHVRKLSFFGSVLRVDFGPDSDIDVLVEFEPGHTIGYFGLSAMELELSEMLGRKVDMRTPPELSRYFRHEIVRNAEVCFAD